MVFFSFLTLSIEENSCPPFSLLTITLDTPVSLSNSGNIYSCPQKSAIVISLPLRKFLTGHWWQDGRRYKSEQNPLKKVFLETLVENETIFFLPSADTSVRLRTKLYFFHPSLLSLKRISTISTFSGRRISPLGIE